MSYSVKREKGKDTWYCSYRFKDYTGKTVQRKKQGFKTKHEAEAYAEDSINAHEGKVSMSFSAFTEIYLSYSKSRLKASSYKTKECLINSRLLPFFKDKLLCEISKQDVIRLQEYLLSQGCKRTYANDVQGQLTAMLSHAVKIYGLAENPSKIVGKLPGATRKERVIWSEDVFNSAVEYEDKDMYVALWYLLFYGGLRIGEALALTEADIATDGVNISKTFSRYHRQDVITSPKTPSSIRFVHLSPFVMNIIKAYISKMYDFDHVKDRIFPVEQHAAGSALKKLVRESGAPSITLHGLRHSHATMLISQGHSIPAVSKRLGHKDVSTTLRIYTHAYDSDDKAIADKLEKSSSSVTDLLRPLQGYVYEPPKLGACGAL